jgi:hypothetical protein
LASSRLSATRPFGPGDGRESPLHAASVARQTGPKQS